MPFTKGHPQYNTGKMHFKKGHVARTTGKKTGIVPSTAFKKGAKPWNTGLKGIHQSPDTEFKAGHTPHNWKGDLVGKDKESNWGVISKIFPNNRKR